MALSASLLELLSRFSRFLGVGTIGFVVDAAVFFTLTSGLGLHYVWGRVIASLVALTVTWILNRSLTFSRNRVHSAQVEFLRYLGASAMGAGANLLAVLVIAPHDAALAHGPAYVAGAATGLVVNFILYDKFVFYGRKKTTALNSDTPEH